MLDINTLMVTYGKHKALNGVSLTVDQSEVVVMLGANGAGKSSLLRAIAGISEGKVTGDITLDSHDLRPMPSDRIVEAGIAFVPEGRGIFGDLSVLENLQLGAYSARARDVFDKNMAKVLDLFPKLHDRRTQIARTMSGGEQQMVGIGRAMMSNPDILMLDEPSLGLSPLLISEIFQIIKRINVEEGVTMLLVEQNAKVALDVADYGYVMELGRIVIDGEAEKLKASKDIQEFYLGANTEGQRDQKRWKQKKTWR